MAEIIIEKSGGWAWGLGGSGQLGNGDTSDSNVPVQVSGSHTFTQIATGSDHSLGLDDSGVLWAWGAGGSGQLGNGGTSNSNVPVQVSGSHTFTQIAAGNRHSLAFESFSKTYYKNDNRGVYTLSDVNRPKSQNKWSDFIPYPDYDLPD